MDASNHAAARDTLIARLSSALAADERIAAAWLAGSSVELSRLKDAE